MNENVKINIAKLVYQRTIAAKSEKRRDFRLSLHLPIEYSFPKSSRLRLAYTIDISENGLLMNTSEKFDIGQNIKLKFYYDSASGLECVQALGEVIRAERLSNSGQDYWYAVRFVDLSSDILRKFRKFLKSLY